MPYLNRCHHPCPHACAAQLRAERDRVSAAGEAATRLRLRRAEAAEREGALADAVRGKRARIAAVLGLTGGWVAGAATSHVQGMTTGSSHGQGAAPNAAPGRVHVSGSSLDLALSAW